MLQQKLIILTFLVLLFQHGDGHTATVCERTTAELDCGGVMAVEEAYYGRTDSTVCEASLPYLNANEECSLDVTSIVATECDGTTFCSFFVNNEKFTDPCVGTYKYLDVAYSCN